MSDIFVDMQAKVGCRYISDLPCMKRAVWFELRRMPLSDYGMEELEDFSPLCVRGTVLHPERSHGAD